jgi:hypothetical protein
MLARRPARNTRQSATSELEPMSLKYEKEAADRVVRHLTGIIEPDLQGQDRESGLPDDPSSDEELVSFGKLHAGSW